MALADDLVAYWKLDESSGNAADATGNGFTLTNNNNTGYAPAKISNGASGTSSNSNKSLSRDGNSPAGVTYTQFGTAWSISFWYNQTTQNATQQTLTGMQVSTGSLRRNLYVQVTSGNLRINVFDGSSNVYNTSHTGSAGNWYFVVLTYDGSTINVYVDNSSVLSQARAFGGFGNAQAGGFGILCERQNNGSFNPFSGLVDEVGVWSRVLGATERTTLFNSGSGVSYPFITLHDPLTAAKGTFTATGKAVGLTVDRSITLADGSFALTGQDPVLEKAFKLFAADGSFSLSGSASDFQAARLLLTSSGSFALSGQAVNLSNSRNVIADTGSYLVVGTPAGIRRQAVIHVPPGAYALTGLSVEFSTGRSFVLSTGYHTLDGSTVSFSTDASTRWMPDPLPGGSWQAGQELIAAGSALFDGFLVYAGQLGVLTSWDLEEQPEPLTAPEDWTPDAIPGGTWYHGQVELNAGDEMYSGLHVYAGQLGEVSSWQADT